ncbi:hypothetical protein POSPLADRAFT_1034712 [Postia placenta MAD-698-R-SB12]|uniref:Uncharacterized protein n=1 Tax=Postia placenta MAD-698-R-SB12 TaxID=670580 RepID=A0A1X6MYC6_9APHY|nr:hypothetical protein POSPLADRAFT_1034712 [Postia placenta MAD-698-R-SB12]OSX61250.1 hypothetical protein POSPLADRAFT_1034712 [Postia placenta MAD-698-R-SB12]
MASGHGAFVLAAAMLAAPLASASGMTINLTTPTVWQRGTNVNETWASDVGPYNSGMFDLLLVNHNSTGATRYTLATNVLTYYEIFWFIVPNVPVSSNYTLQAVNLTNYADVYDQSGTFSID